MYMTHNEYRLPDLAKCELRPRLYRNFREVANWKLPRASASTKLETEVMERSSLEQAERQLDHIDCDRQSHTMGTHAPG